MALLLLVLASAGFSLAAPGSVCSQLPYKAVLPLSKNCFVESFCSSAFPVAPTTVTKSTVTTTSTITTSSTTTLTTTTIPTITVVSTESDTTTTTVSLTQTLTETDTATATTTSTIQTITTSTSTIVTSGNGATYKRDAAVEPLVTASPDIKARAAAPANNHGFKSNTRAQLASAAFAAWQKPLAGLKPTLSTACSCIETPRTILVTKTSTVSTTSTSTIPITSTITQPTTTTSVVTSTVTGTDYETTTTTSTTTTTTTTTATAITSSTSVAYFDACGQVFSAPVTGTPIKVVCGSTVGGSYNVIQTITTADYYDCLTAGDANGASNSFTYQFSTGICSILANGNNSQYVPNSDFVYSYFYP